MEDQPDWLLFWAYFDKLRPHKSGKRVICGHSVQKSGMIKDVGFARCIDTDPAGGGWLTCLGGKTPALTGRRTKRERSAKAFCRRSA